MNLNFSTNSFGGQNGPQNCHSAQPLQDESYGPEIYQGKKGEREQSTDDPEGTNERVNNNKDGDFERILHDRSDFRSFLEEENVGYIFGNEIQTQNIPFKDALTEPDDDENQLPTDTDQASDFNRSDQSSPSKNESERESESEGEDSSTNYNSNVHSGYNRVIEAINIYLCYPKFLEIHCKKISEFNYSYSLYSYFQKLQNKLVGNEAFSEYFNQFTNIVDKFESGITMDPFRSLFRDQRSKNFFKLDKELFKMLQNLRLWKKENLEIFKNFCHSYRGRIIGTLEISAKKWSKVFRPKKPKTSQVPEDNDEQNNSQNNDFNIDDFVSTDDIILKEVYHLDLTNRKLTKDQKNFLKGIKFKISFLLKDRIVNNHFEGLEEDMEIEVLFPCSLTKEYLQFDQLSLKDKEDFKKVICKQSSVLRDEYKDKGFRFVDNNGLQVRKHSSGGESVDGDKLKYPELESVIDSGMSGLEDMERHSEGILGKRAQYSEQKELGIKQGQKKKKLGMQVFEEKNQADRFRSNGQKKKKLGMQVFGEKNQADRLRSNGQKKSRGRSKKRPKKSKKKKKKKSGNNQHNPNNQDHELNTIRNSFVND